MKNWTLHHIAVVVHDIDKAVQYYESLGIIKFGREVIFPESQPKIRAKFVEVGSIPIEFVQPIGGEASTYKEFLNRKGEGIHHIAFAVDDLEKETKELLDRGVSLIARRPAAAASGSIAAHFDTTRVGDFDIQLIQEPA